MLGEIGAQEREHVLTDHGEQLGRREMLETRPAEIFVARPPLLPTPSLPAGKTRRPIGFLSRLALFYSSVWRSSRRRMKSR